MVLTRFLHPVACGSWCCMAQGERTPKEQADFKRMLPRINMLYLGCSVLLIVDNTYLGRFWTCFEAWLSMQQCSPAGLEPTREGAQRYAIKCIHLAKDKFQGVWLRELWTETTPEQALEILSSTDVTVTNQSDKDVQLPKLLRLNEEIRACFRRQQPVQPAKQEARVDNVSPPAGTLADKVHRIKVELGLDMEMPMAAAIKQANELMGIQPEGTMPMQADALMVALGV